MLPVLPTTKAKLPATVDVEQQPVRTAEPFELDIEKDAPSPKHLLCTNAYKNSLELIMIDYDDDYASYMADDGPEVLEEGICSTCSGSGEGQYDGSICPVCKGEGEC